jgi:hypothetical protein
MLSHEEIVYQIKGYAEARCWNHVIRLIQTDDLMEPKLMSSDSLDDMFITYNLCGGICDLMRTQ